MKLSYADYYDKVLGTWIGKCAGGILGAPIEGVKDFNKIRLSEKLFETNYPNDDLDLQLLWLDMVKQKGVFVRENDFAEHWRNHVGFPWNEYGIASRNLRLGLFPPESGRHNNYYYNESMGCPIRSELWGLLNPGDPEKAVQFAEMDASVDHDKFSVDAEKFLSACTSLAFFERNFSTIFRKALQFVSPESTMAQLVNNIVYWHKNGGYKVARGKIKSYYGDADFTSAPMNVGFTLLTLLEKGVDFGCVMDALHMGHDSDCIAATAGALVGTIFGYDKIPDNWKKMVGDELIMSVEITGIIPPVSITNLAKQTCRAGLSFIEASGKVKLKEVTIEPYQNAQPPYFHVKSFLEDNDLVLVYENFTTKTQSVNIGLKSKKIKFKNPQIDFKVAAGKSVTCKTEIKLPFSEEPTLEYDIEVNIGGKFHQKLKRGVPRYGSWLLAGPFLQDDKATLDKYFEGYPEHGLSSLPSVQYMNHDKVNTGTQFLSMREIKSLIDEDSWKLKPYNVSRIFPEDFRLLPQNWYYGKGERTIYLYSTIQFEKAEKKWICLGATSPFELFVNDKKIAEEKNSRRCWIGNTIIPHQFKKGKNHIVLRLDLVIDNNQLEFGLKDYTGKHPHQEQWALMVPSIKIK